ncbi:MAG: MBL fold metallo-hydrolase [Candidatus Aminicenantes bacterium]|nr:MBL fold metallo-hydrolase [Candidatus Aminicenantes bacterium]
MLIRCWGARGSIPVCGEEYLKYGGDTTCIEIRSAEDDIIIIDAGSGIRKLGEQLLVENRQTLNILFTHSHLDHILGFPFFKPLYFKGKHINVYGCSLPGNSVKEILSTAMSSPFFPVSLDDFKAEISYHGVCGDIFSIGSIEITPILLSHPNGGFGYKFVEEGQSFVFLTDNELTYKHPGGLEYRDYLSFSANAGLLIHDAEFTREEYKQKKKWGHSVYNVALQLAFEARVKRFGLFHHNQDRTDAALDSIVRDCRDIIGSRKSKLECFAVHQGMEIDLKPEI